MILCVTSLGHAQLGGSSGLGRAHSCICCQLGTRWSGMASVRIALLCFTLPLVLQQTTLGLFTKVFKRVNGSARGLLGSKLRTNITLPHFIGQMKLQRKPRLKGWRKTEFYNKSKKVIKKAGRRRMDAFELWCWRRLLSVPWMARRANQSILMEISPEYSL